MSLQGPILIVADDTGTLVKAFTEAGAFPVMDVSWAGVATAAAEIQPAAIILNEPGPADSHAVTALAADIEKAAVFTPLIIRLRQDAPSALPDALPISDDAPIEQMIARVSSALRLRTLHSTVIARARSLKDERNIVAEPPAGDPLDDATVLLVGRGRHHATLSVAVGERMGVIGALSIDHAAGCLKAREVDGVIIGDGLSANLVDAFLTVLSEDRRFRDLPIAVLNASYDPGNLPNFIAARDPVTSARSHSYACGRARPRSSGCWRRSNAKACSMRKPACSTSAPLAKRLPAPSRTPPNGVCGCRWPVFRSKIRSTGGPVWMLQG